MTSDNQELRLGRGLGSMIEEVSGIKAGLSGPGSGSGFTRVPRRLLDPEGWLTGHHVGESEFQRLVASIRDHGMVQPVLARKVGERYALISGGLRVKAAGQAGLEDVPVKLVSEEGKEAFELFLADHTVGRLLPRKERKRLRTYMVRELGETPARALERVPDPLAPRGTRRAKAAIRKIQALPPPQRSQVVIAITLAVVGVVAALSVTWVRLAEKLQARRMVARTEVALPLPLPQPVPPAAVLAEPVRTEPVMAPVPAVPAVPAQVDRSWMRRFTLPGLALEPGESSLGIVFTEPMFDGEELPQVARDLATRLGDLGDARVVVTGYSPSVEEAEDPEAAARERAERFAGYLREQGGLSRGAIRVQVAGGEGLPFPDTEAFSALNRTVTLHVERGNGAGR
ncbi:MAG TPA: ParB/RepB/Spo0J family partition protein [Kiritimatiellia bacterium]|nr:ParB/RepB/Spo0J family partition protein [Kiritimatiellia bacterium]